MWQGRRRKHSWQQTGAGLRERAGERGIAGLGRRYSGSARGVRVRWLLTVAGACIGTRRPSYAPSSAREGGTSAGVPHSGHHRFVRPTGPCSTAKAHRLDAAEHRSLLCPVVAQQCSLRARPTSPPQQPLRATRREKPPPDGRRAPKCRPVNTDAGTRGTRRRVTWQRGPPPPPRTARAGSHRATVEAAAAARRWGDARPRAAGGRRAPPCASAWRRTRRPTGRPRWRRRLGDAPRCGSGGICRRTSEAATGSSKANYTRAPTRSGS